MSWPRALTALGGAALLASLWLTWFEYQGATSIPVDGDRIDVFVGADSGTGWDLLSGEAVALAAIGLVALAALIRPVAVLALRVLGPVAAGLVLWTLLTPPEGMRAAVGAYVALGAAIVATAAAWRRTRAA